MVMVARTDVRRARPAGPPKPRPALTSRRSSGNCASRSRPPGPLRAARGFRSRSRHPRGSALPQRAEGDPSPAAQRLERRDDERDPVTPGGPRDLGPLDERDRRDDQQSSGRRDRQQPRQRRDERLQASTRHVPRTRARGRRRMPSNRKRGDRLFDGIGGGQLLVSPSSVTTSRQGAMEADRPQSRPAPLTAAATSCRPGREGPASPDPQRQVSPSLARRRRSS